MSNSETARLKTLGLYKILDTANEQAFDDLTRLAASICETPISLVTLIDENRQWFKSRHGLATTETPRDQAFCAHAIRSDVPMIVEDAHKDQRFADNPLVTSDPNIRFYAGIPLIVNEGFKLGTLCVIDRIPRKLTASQLDSLQVLRDAVVNLLELRRNIEDMKLINQILPMCAWCRNVRIESEEEVTWQPLHEYVQSLTEVTHGICPSCRSSLSEKGLIT